MSELQMYHLIATGTLAVLLGILGFLGKGVLEDMKTKLSKDEFASYLQEAKTSRAELRESIVKLFEKMENHDKMDVMRFDGIVKDFNGGLARMTDTLYQSKLEIFDRINGKADKART